MVVLPPSLESTIHFLKRDPLYDTVKVFENRMEDLKNVPKTNATLDRKDVMIEDFRGKESSLDTNGFVYMNLDSGMSAEDFDETSKILGMYLPQLSEAVRKLLGADRIQIYDFTVSSFPLRRLRLSSCRFASDMPLIRLSIPRPFWATTGSQQMQHT